MRAFLKQWQKIVALNALVVVSMPVFAFAAVAPSAQTIFRQSFTNLGQVSSYDVSGTVVITKPTTTVPTKVSDQSIADDFFNGNELRAPFTGTVDRKQNLYNLTAAIYNHKTGESPLLEVVGSEHGPVNIRISGLTLSTTTDETGVVGQYLNTWIRFDNSKLPGTLSNPLLALGVGTQTNSSDGLAQTFLQPFDEKKITELNRSINQAFWKRNVVSAKRLADGKDHAGAPAYRLSLKINPVGLRAFFSDSLRLFGQKITTSDVKELECSLKSAPVVTGDLIVSKKDLLPEVLVLNSTGGGKAVPGNLTMKIKLNFEHIGSGRAIVLPANYKEFKDILTAILQGVAASSTITSTISSTTTLP